MRIAVVALLASLLFHPTPAFADAFDDCVDKAWEDYFECSADCGGTLGCQSKCSAKKVKDLKACDGKGVKRLRSASGKVESLLMNAAGASTSNCAVSRNSNGSALLLTLSAGCNEPQAVTIQWVSANGLSQYVTYNVGVLGRWVQFRGSGLNEHPTVKVEPMKVVLGNDAVSLITPRKNENYSCPALFYNNGTNRYVAITFEVPVGGGQKMRQNAVLPPQKDVPVYSGCEPAGWQPTTIGAQLDPE